jgi:hypothetical protein
MGPRLDSPGLALIGLVLGLAGAPACGETRLGPVELGRTDAGTLAAADAETTPPSSSPPRCALCIQDSDCPGGWICAQFGGDSFCAPSCAPMNACSDTERSCEILTSATGQQVSACVPLSNGCGDQAEPPDAGPAAASDAAPIASPDGGGLSCGALVGPDTPAACHGCRSGNTSCQPNGCYGGWWCNTGVTRCQAPPAAGSCTGGTGSTGGTGGAADGGPAADSGASGTGTGDSGLGFLDAGSDGAGGGSVGPSGGTLDVLRFAIVGDTRPGGIDDTGGYPTAIIGRIWQDIEDESPRPAFAVTTGDYMFASPNGTQAGQQLGLYLAARAAFSNVLFPAMGNHECTGATAGNCATTTTNNLNAYLSMLLGPIGQTKPYYSVNIAATNGSWTAKFVFVAANAWDADQGTWLESVLAQPTTYTFVIRHERKSVTQAPGVAPSEQIIAQHPLTMRIVGHTHTYSYAGGQEVVIGNGGAPVTGGVNYGYAIAEQRSDGAIAFTMKDYQTKQAFASFAITAGGTPTP